MSKTFHIFSNEDEASVRISKELTEKMNAAGYEISESEKGVDFIFCIGGDGALLRLLHAYRFPQEPIVGINTGHLGFFQEITPEGIDDFLGKLSTGNYHIQEYIGLEIEVTDSKGSKTHLVINEVVVKGLGERLAHLDIMLEKNNITRYSGDGILVCTPAGSTAYNYSLGGVIVDPDVDTLQITPMAPVNNTAYRSFNSGILVPTDSTIEIMPTHEGQEMIVIEDGKVVSKSNDIKKVSIKVADRKAHIFRFSDYNFWTKVQDKILGR